MDAIERRAVYKCRLCGTRLCGDSHKGIFPESPQTTTHQCNVYHFSDENRTEKWTGIADLVGYEEDFPLGEED